MLDAGSSAGVVAVVFHPDGKHLLGGSNTEMQRWRFEDGQEVGKQARMDVYAISVSSDHKWILCGTERGASVWDAEMQEKVVDVEGGKTVMAVDVSPDSTTFATGTGLSHNEASVWNLTTGKRLVGPLKHDSHITTVRFSPDGACIATACWEGSEIRVFDSCNGHKLKTINTRMPSIRPCTPLAWSNDSQQIFAVSYENKIKLFDVSTGSQLAESQTLDGGDGDSIALAANGKFVAAFADSVISLLDTSTLILIDPVIRDSREIYSISLSPDSGYLATGDEDGKITIRDLGGILPDVYGPFHVSIYPFTMRAY